MRKGPLFLFALIAVNAYAQTDGPCANLPYPTGVCAINVKYLNLDQNILPSVKECDGHCRCGSRYTDTYLCIGKNPGKGLCLGCACYVF